MTETAQQVEIRVYAEYQMCGDMDAEPWMDLVFGFAKQEGQILAYNFIHAVNSKWGIRHICFSTDMMLEASSSYDETANAACTLLNSIVGDSDIVIKGMIAIDCTNPDCPKAGKCGGQCVENF